MSFSFLYFLRCGAATISEWIRPLIDVISLCRREVKYSAHFYKTLHGRNHSGSEVALSINVQCNLFSLLSCCIFSSPSAGTPFNSFSSYLCELTDMISISCANIDYLTHLYLNMLAIVMPYALYV
jgi:hypothetical protein